MEIDEKILEQLKEVPQSPGVYLLRGSEGRILYVGKAKRLRNRLASYFRSTQTHSVKTQTLIVNTRDFEYILTTTETEALLLEANLIKRHQPKFNILLKDDKSYPFVKLTGEDFPRLKKTRDSRGGGIYYGPFASDFDVNQTLVALKMLYPLRRCDVPLASIRRPCLYYHMGQCVGPCTGNVSVDEYDSHVEKVRKFFSGDRGEVIEELERRRDEAASKLQFEQAMEYRDLALSASRLSLYQKITHVSSGNEDILGLSRVEEKICVTLFIRREGKIIDRENHVFTPLEEDSALNMESFILQYYAEAYALPGEILVSHEPASVCALEEILSEKEGRKVRIRVPKRGEKKQMVEMALVNAKEYLEKFRKVIVSAEEKQKEIELILSSIISRDRVERLEIYDISNMSGFLSVGSMVVYERGKKKPSDYRKFRIKHVKGPDDVRSMEEVITRRLARLQESSFGKRPDLILVDGGVGQVGAAKAALAKLGEDIAVMGLVKDNHHRTDHLFFEGRKIPLERDTAIYRFFYGMQEEVHRFALAYHRKLRGKSLAFTLLDEIPLIGEKRKTALMKHFETLEKLSRASIEEILEVKEMDRPSAHNVYMHFREEEDETVDRV